MQKVCYVNNYTKANGHEKEVIRRSAFMSNAKSLFVWLNNVSMTAFV